MVRQVFSVTDEYQTSIALTEGMSLEDSNALSIDLVQCRPFTTAVDWKSLGAELGNL
jgi:hypothetical protein